VILRLGEELHNATIGFSPMVSKTPNEGIAVMLEEYMIQISLSLELKLNLSARNVISRVCDGRADLLRLLWFLVCASGACTSVLV